MASVFTESHIQFEFDPLYELVHSDKEVNFDNVKRFLQNTKDVDFLGFYGSDIVFFMEVKNFRGYPIEDIDQLTTEVAQKLRDTVATVAGASRNTTHNEDFWQKLHQQIGNKKKTIKFVFFLEEDMSQSKRNPGRMKTIGDHLKQKCRWLTTKVSVQNLQEMKLEGLKASFIQQ